MSELPHYDQATNKCISTSRIIPLDSITDCSDLKFYAYPTAGPKKEGTPLQLWRKLEAPLTAQNDHHGPTTLQYIPALFEIIGQISRRDCFLTTSGNREFFHLIPDDRALVSCYIEARPTNKSHIQWGRYHRALMKMVEFTGHPNVNRKGLFLVDAETLLPRIEVFRSSPLGREVSFDASSIGNALTPINSG